MTKSRSSAVLAGAVLIALVIGGAVGYFARASEVSALMNQNSMMHQELQSEPSAFQLTPASGPMPPHNVWFVIAPLGSGDYALILSAQGLETSGSYLIEGVTRTGQMNQVPISGNATSSEFTPNMHGDGVYWSVLMSDPRVTYDKIVLLYLPDMQMSNAQEVASATLG